MSQKISEIRTKKIPFETKVYYQPEPSVTGIGKIVGIANSGDPIVGLSYIIESDKHVSKVYPYTHFVCPEIFLKEI